MTIVRLTPPTRDALRRAENTCAELLAFVREPAFGLDTVTQAAARLRAAVDALMADAGKTPCA